MLDYNNTLSKLYKDFYFEDPNFMLQSLNIGVGIRKKYKNVG